MTIPQWTLFYFALWTILVLIATVGVMRWTLILSGQVEPREFSADEPHGSARYRRAMRAHANCVENLPVYAAFIFALTLLKLDTPLLDSLALVFISARICQTLIHIAFNATNSMVFARFIFFFLQIIIMFWMAVLIIIK